MYMRYETKKQLALAYCPSIGYSSAMKKLNAWIQLNTELTARLKRTGYVATQRHLTPQQERLILEYLGDP